MFDPSTHFNDDEPPPPDFEYEEEEQLDEEEMMMMAQQELAAMDKENVKPTNSNSNVEPDLKKIRLEDRLDDHNIEDENFLNENDFDDFEQQITSTQEPFQNAQNSTFISQAISSNLPTLKQIQSKNLETQRKEQLAKNTFLRNQILKSRESQSIRKQMSEINKDGSRNNNNFNSNNAYSKEHYGNVLLVKPQSSKSCHLKRCDGNFSLQYFMRKNMEQDRQFSDDNAKLSSIYKESDFKKMKFSALKNLAARKKRKDVSRKVIDQAKNKNTNSISQMFPVSRKKQGHPTKKTINKNDQLLVNKFAPNHFTHLLSDASTNRVLLKWLQLWGHCVFNKPLMQKPVEKDPEESGMGMSNFSSDNQNFRTKYSKNTQKFENRSKAFQNFQKGSTFNNNYKFKRYDPLLEEYNYDSLKRPKHKIILLSGPAGLGKTTLAHIAAKHCGYQVQEINSSDDRSAGSIKTLIRKYLTGSDVRNGMVSLEEGEKKDRNKTFSRSQESGKLRTKPVCLVFDEIDGASAAAINVIVDLANSTNNQQSSKNKNKKSKNLILKTPIIAICNDLYTPSLRNLRNNALILHVPQLESHNMIRRLKEIHQSDEILRKIEIPATVLEHIVLKSNKDIRTALNSLQYVFNMKDVTVAKLEEINIGVKNIQKSLFDLWREFFKLKDVKDYKKQLKLQASKKRDSKGRNLWGEHENTDNISDRRASNFKNGLNIIFSSGESNYEKILGGIYENFLFSTKSDTHFKIIRTAEKTLVNFDLLQTKIRQTQNYSIMGFLPIFLTGFHMKYATGGGLYTKLKYPSLHAENYKKKMANIEFLRKLQNTNTTGLYFGKSQNSVSDLLVGLPLVSKITEFPGPSRNVAPPMYNQQEREFIIEQVDRIVSSNLTINQEKVSINFNDPNNQTFSSNFGGYEYVIEPNIFALSKLCFSRIERIGDLEVKKLAGPGGYSKYDSKNKQKNENSDLTRETEPLSGPALKVSCNITYAQTQYLANIMQREITERFERAQQIRNTESKLNSSLKTKKSNNKNSDKNNLQTTPERPKNPKQQLSGSSTPYQVVRLHDLTHKQNNLEKNQINVIDENSKNSTWNRKEMWKKFLDVEHTPKPAEVISRNRANQVSGNSSKSYDSDYQLEFDPGIANSDVYFKYRKGFCKSVRATVRAWEYL